MPDNKFEEEDLPKILASIKQARASGMFWTLTINGGTNGGISGIMLKIEKKVK
jgi:hypothetical protein